MEDINGMECGTECLNRTFELSFSSYEEIASWSIFGRLF